MDIEDLRKAMMETRLKVSSESLGSTGSVEREVNMSNNNNNASASGRNAPVNLFRDIGEIPSKSGKKRKNRESMTPEELHEKLGATRDSSSDEELREINTPPPGKKRRKVTVRKKGGKKRKTRRKKSKTRRKTRRKRRRKKKTKKGGKRRTRKKRGKGKKRKRDEKSSGKGSSSGSSKKNTTRKKQKKITDYKMKNFDDNQCAICLEPLIGNLENYCNRHQFHRECYQRLIDQNIDRCPTCRGQGTQLTRDRLREREIDRLREEYNDPQIQTYEPPTQQQHYPHQVMQMFECGWCGRQEEGVEGQGPLTWIIDDDGDWMCPQCRERENYNDSD